MTRVPHAVDRAGSTGDAEGDQQERGEGVEADRNDGEAKNVSCPGRHRLSGEQDKQAEAKDAAAETKAAEAKADEADAEATEAATLVDTDAAEEAEAPAKEVPAGAVAAAEDGSSPDAEYTVKGNGDSGKYHEPDGQWYDQTIAEFWFKSAEDAEAAGFTKAGA